MQQQTVAVIGAGEGVHTAATELLMLTPNNQAPVGCPC